MGDVGEATATLGDSYTTGCAAGESEGRALAAGVHCGAARRRTAPRAMSGRSRGPSGRDYGAGEAAARAGHAGRAGRAGGVDAARWRESILIALPYRVNDTEGSARFDRQTEQMEIRLPVVGHGETEEIGLEHVRTGIVPPQGR